MKWYPTTFQQHDTSIFKCLLFTFLLLAPLLVCSSAPAQPQTGHYFAGANGLEAALPMPHGFMYINNIFLYTTDNIKDKNGNSTEIGHIDVFVNAAMPIYTFKNKILGATYSVASVIPLQNTGLYIDTFEDDSVWGMGDVLFIPLWLTWQKESLFVTLRYGFFAPTGRFELNSLDNVGLGYWTHQAVSGLTYFFGPDASWHASIMGRIEVHTEQEGHDLRPGANAVFEYGLGKEVAPGLNIGLTGYSNIQIESESGTAASVDSSRYSVHALGGEISYHLPDTGWIFKLRCNKEFSAINRSEGISGVVTIGYFF